MIVECTTCKREIGERCPQCGSQNVSKFQSGERFCNGCTLEFHVGDGGVTGMVCQECLEKELGIDEPETAGGELCLSQ